MKETPNTTVFAPDAPSGLQQRRVEVARQPVHIADGANLRYIQVRDYCFSYRSSQVLFDLKMDIPERQGNLGIPYQGACILPDRGSDPQVLVFPRDDDLAFDSLCCPLLLDNIFRGFCRIIK